MSSSGYHPNIGSIIRVRDQIFTALYVNKNVKSFLDQSIGLMALLKPDDYSDEFIEKILKEQEFFDKNQSRTREITHLRSYRKMYNKWFKELNKILWDGKYLENKTYSPETKKDTTFNGKKIIPWNKDGQ